jgi:hypothetical protein
MTWRRWLVWLVGLVDRLAGILPHAGGQAGRRLGEWG